jgi:hypothetical protein
MDRDGYGNRPGQTAIERLLEDSRTLSPLGVERVASGWEHHAGSGTHDDYRKAERAALHVLETSGRARQWDELRNQLLGLTERPGAMVSWRVEHGNVGHKAEDALLGAALALLAGSDLDQPHHEALVRPMAEALPWLLGSTAS